MSIEPVAGGGWFFYIGKDPGGTRDYIFHMLLLTDDRRQTQHRIQDSSFSPFQKLLPVKCGESLHVMFIKHF